MWEKKGAASWGRVITLGEWSGLDSLVDGGGLSWL